MDDFKLSSDDTMRNLRNIAQAPGELKWRLELLDALNRMRVQQEVSNRGILQILAKMRKDVSYLSPIKLAELMNAQIVQSRKAEDAQNWKVAVKYVLTHLGTVGFTLLMVYLTTRLKR